MREVTNTMISRNELVRQLYKISFVSGLTIEVVLNQKELRELTHKKKISGYKVIATGIE